MSDPYEERASDSPFVGSIGWGFAETDGAAVLHADCQWYMVFMRHNGKTRLAVGGPVSKTWYLPYTAGTEWLGIRFTTGTFMPHLSATNLLNNLIYLPEAAHKGSLGISGVALIYRHSSQANRR